MACRYIRREEHMDLQKSAWAKESDAGAETISDW